MNFTLLCAIGFLFGIGFGYFVQRAGLCFAHGLGEIYMGKGKRILKLFLVIFIITSLGFLISGYLNPKLGLKTIGQIRGFGFFNILSGALFGAGILLNGGCILGTLRQIGEGNMTFLIVMLSFIPGMALVVYVINPYLIESYQVQNLLLSQVLNIPAYFITGFLLLLSLAGLWMLIRPRKG